MQTASLRFLTRVAMFILYSDNRILDKSIASKFIASEFMIWWLS